MKYNLVLAFWMSIICVMSGVAKAQIQPYFFTVQQVCPDYGPPWTCSPDQANIQLAGWPAFWRKHDLEISPPPGAGQQISDAALMDDGSSVVDTFSFNPFNPSWVPQWGDGGQVLVSDGWTVRVDRTQDSGNPMQYFVGANCGGTGWIAFRADAPFEAWKPEIDYLADTPNPYDCPALNPAYLQYALVNEAWPIWWNGSYFVPIIQTIISEHYDNTAISNATFMERTYYAYQLGLVRWAAWESPDGGQPVDPYMNCPQIGNDQAPSDGRQWTMYACRQWTNIQSGAPYYGWTVDTFGWPG